MEEKVAGGYLASRDCGLYLSSCSGRRGDCDDEAGGSKTHSFGDCLTATGALPAPWTEGSTRGNTSNKKRESSRMG